MAYSAEKQNAVVDLIDNSTCSYLEVYTRKDIINKAIKAMEKNASAIEVADAVYDYIYNNNSDNIVISTALNTCMPKNSLFILRQEIIDILK